MKKLLVKDILKVTEGKLVIGDCEEVLENFSKDTRQIKENDTYVAIKGANFDGNKFWKQALEKGAKAVIVQDIDFSKEDLTKYKNKIIIKTKDVLESLYEIAKYKRSLYDIPVVGVTGSVGKTSTKDVIASVLSKKYKTLKTEGNNNNNIGLPFTILNLKDHEAAVIEMGMNHFNEISLLTKIAKPTISVITNIGTSHIGNLGSRQNILKAKLEILEGMTKPLLVLNNDNDMLHDYYEKNKENIKMITYGIENKSDLMANDIIKKENESIFSYEYNQKKYKVKVPVGGEHFILNSLCAIEVGRLLNIEDEAIIKGIEEFKLTNKRMDISTLKNGATIINDSYNASFESMKASLKNLSEYKNKRKIAVLGDMFELGSFSEQLHKNVGEEVYNNKIDILICAGENAKFIAKQAESLGMNKENIFYFKDKNEIVDKLKSIINKDDIILFKASNGMRFFDIVENIK